MALPLKPVHRPAKMSNDGHRKAENAVFGIQSSRRDARMPK